MLKMCGELPPNFRVHSTRCWIKDFRNWLIGRGQRFPTQRFGDFQAEVQSFLQSQPIATSDMWFNEEGEMHATVFTLYLREADLATEEIVEERTRWNDYIDRANAEAGSTAAGAWVTSAAWVSAEAQSEAMLNAWHVALLAIFLTLVAGLFYMQDFQILLYIGILVIFACFFLAFFMYCLFGWATGPWEVVLLVVFLGYSIEPAFRIGSATVPEGFKLNTLINIALPEKNAANLENQDVGLSGIVQSEAAGEPEVAGEDPVALMGGEPEGEGAQGEGTEGEDTKGPLALPDGEPEGEGTEGALEGGLAIQHAAADETGSNADNDGDNDAGDDAVKSDSVNSVNGDDNVANMRMIEGSSFGSRAAEAARTDAQNATEVRVREAVFLIASPYLGAALKLVVCGLLLLPCQFRLFSRLGAVAVVVPIIAVPFTFILLPSAIYVFGPRVETPDTVLLFQFAKVRLNRQMER